MSRVVAPLVAAVLIVWLAYCATETAVSVVARVLGVRS